MKKKWWTPTTILWLLTHSLLVLVGIVFLSADPVVRSLGAGISHGIGGSLVATGVAGVATFLFVRVNDQLATRVAAVVAAGVVDIFPVRQVRIRDEYERRLNNARQIDLVGYGLGNFREDFANRFTAWSADAKIRILLVDPNFPSAEHSLADQRDREEGRDPGRTRQDVERFEAEVLGQAGLNRENFQVRRMRAIPAINMLRIDDEIFWGPYLMSAQSRNTPTVLVRRGGFLFSALNQHFESLWKGGLALARERAS